MILLVVLCQIVQRLLIHWLRAARYIPVVLLAPVFKARGTRFVVQTPLPAQEMEKLVVVRALLLFVSRILSEIPFAVQDRWELLVEVIAATALLGRFARTI